MTSLLSYLSYLILIDYSVLKSVLAIEASEHRIGRIGSPSANPVVEVCQQTDYYISIIFVQVENG